MTLGKAEPEAATAGDDEVHDRRAQGAGGWAGVIADADANVIFGASFSESLGEDVLITLIATGLNRHERTQAPPVEASVNVSPASVAEANTPPKQAMRTVKQVPGVEAVAAPAVAAPGEASDQAYQASPTPEEVDLEVPSFLRRKGQPTGRA